MFPLNLFKEKVLSIRDCALISFFPLLVAQGGGGIASLSASLGLSPDLVAILGGAPRGIPAGHWMVKYVVCKCVKLPDKHVMHGREGLHLL